MTTNPFTIIGETDFRDHCRRFGMLTADRRLHLAILGKTGSGKSTLLKRLITQDLRNGHGVGVVDVHGQLIQDLLPYIPARRIDDFILFNPADYEFPIGFNILEQVAPEHRALVASQILTVFKAVWGEESIGPRSDYILTNTVLALLDVAGTTLLGVQRMLTDRAYQAAIIPRIENPIVKRFWTVEYPGWDARYRKDAVAPIQNKIGQFLMASSVRNIIGQVATKMNMATIMDESQILFCDLAKGKIGPEKSSLLGSLIVTKLFLAALARSDQPEEERKDFFLYIDECQNLASTILAPIFSEARKYRLNLTVSNQYMPQLHPEVQAALIGNVGTLITFRLGADDAHALAPEFAPEVEALDLENTGRHQVYIKMAHEGMTIRPFSARTLPLDPPRKDEDKAETAIKNSRQSYSTPRAVVEEKIMRWLSDPDATAEASQPGTPLRPKGRKAKKTAS